MVTRCNHFARRVEGSDTLAVIENLATKFAADSPPSTVAADKIPADKMGLDIGPESVILRAAVERQDGVLERADQGFRVPGLSPPNYHRGGSRGRISFR
jgi:3-phosphoglycerate kinase